MMPKHPDSSERFKEARVKATLGAWYDRHAESPLRRRRSADECRRSGGTVFDVLPEISSVQAVPVLLQVEPLLGFELSKSVIRRGGYNGREQFVEDLASRLKSEYEKRHRLAGPVAPAMAEEVRTNV